MTIPIVFLISLMLVTSTRAATTSLRSEPRVNFENERLSVRANDVPLKDLLGDIGAKSGIVIVLTDPKAAVKQSSVDFKGLPSTLAFRTILQDSNFAFFYSGTQLMWVLILPAVNQSAKASSGLTNPDAIGRQMNNAPLSPAARPTPPEGHTQENDIKAKLEAIAAMEDSDDAENIAALEKVLTDGHHKVKEAALRALAHKKGAAVTQVLRRGLIDSDPEFRIEVLEILSALGDFDSLRKSVADRNQEVRETAADLLWNVTIQK